jgi:hypothetical protein
MKLEVKGKLWDRLLETKAGRFASTLDALLYSAVETDTTYSRSVLALSQYTTDKTDNHESKPTEKFLQELRDYLYQVGLEELG